MAVKVKKLEWRDTVGVQTAGTIFGVYAAFKPDHDWQLRLNCKVISRHPDEATAKAAGQDHFEECILSSIEQE